MSQPNSAYLEHQLKRWMRPDADRFIRPDWRRYVRPGFEDDHPFALYERKYSQDQPRVPAGSREGGQWTGGEGAYLAAPSDTPSPREDDGNNAKPLPGNESAYPDEILDRMTQVAARGYSSDYLKCLDLCYLS